MSRTVRIIMNGVTGRMGRNQHLVRSILAIRQQGGVTLPDGTAVTPEPVLVGRSSEKLQVLARSHGIQRWTTSLDEALSDPQAPIYFDAQITAARAAALERAIAAGKHVYCEKPVASDLATALHLARLARERGVANGVVQDKLFLPGIRKLQRLMDSGFFGRVLSVQLQFGYWVFEGDWQPAQRPSWNYRREQGGGIVLDMFCHWQYVLENLFGRIRSLVCLAATHIPQRYDEGGHPYECTAEDAAYAILQLDQGVVAHIISSWTVRVRRDDLLQIQVDGTHGTAVAGLRECYIQHRSFTPRAVWNPDVPKDHDYYADWFPVPDNETFENAFKVQWEMFLRHALGGAPYRWDFLEGARGLQVVEAAYASWRDRRWVDLPELTL
ncbi:MAG: Gfo/Idh/MocA family oxidoreductase [Armatimonadota bacterium]|nr:Gfo/Idh/MocA family oxidoreductase [Armatimonadota bacterium]MDW8155628.1 Gfo/Idh/MocA family oxidoreductase [Armatimonadota bacterium]